MNRRALSERTLEFTPFMRKLLQTKPRNLHAVLVAMRHRLGIVPEPVTPAGPVHLRQPPPPPPPAPRGGKSAGAHAKTSPGVTVTAAKPTPAVASTANGLHKASLVVQKRVATG